MSVGPERRARAEGRRGGRVMVGARTPALVALAAAVAFAACGNDPTDVVYQVIEETEFAAELDIDLDSMTDIGNGVYIQDLIVGTGDQVVYGSSPTVTYTGWLSDGTSFGTGTFSFLLGGGNVILGFQDGMVGMNVGGTRRIIIPPDRGYGGEDQVDQAGNVVIPAGSILIYEVTVDDLVPAPR